MIAEKIPFTTAWSPSTQDKAHLIYADAAVHGVRQGCERGTTQKFAVSVALKYLSHFASQGLLPPSYDGPPPSRMEALEEQQRNSMR